ncbi:MAG: hypothetical protein ACJ731_04165 [Vicinamibacterales bacterium]
MPNWLRVIDTVTGLARTAGRLRATFEAPPTDIAEGSSRSLETRLAGVVVAALKEAFDRDRARMDLERTQVEAEQRRAEQALAAELRRQTADRALGQLKLLATMAIATWMLSAALAVWLPGMRGGIPRGLLGAGWALSFGVLGCTFAAFQTISSWSAAAQNSSAPASTAGAAAPWLLVLALASTGASLLAAL